MNAHCEWGFCECNRGLEKKYGRCERSWAGQQGRGADFDPFQSCLETNTCQNLDINLVCNTNVTIQAGGKCECRRDMKWNTQAGECQLYMDVDCSTITYDTKPSPVILEAVNKTLEKIAENNATEPTVVEVNPDTNATEPISPEKALSNSLLSSIDVNKTSEAELKEAYCRDVDSFSWEFGAPRNQEQNQRYPNRQNTGGGGFAAGSAVIIGILIFFGVCCACGVCFAFKKSKNKMSGRRSPEPPVTFTDMTVADAGLYQPNLHNNPGFKSEPTPLHSAGAPTHAVSNTGAIYPGPAAIPPTQPGYTNFPPGEGGSPYPPQPAAYPAPYPSSQPNVYPPPQAAPYPPPDGGLPYPPQPAASYPPIGQPAYNPTAHY